MWKNSLPVTHLGKSSLVMVSTFMAELTITACLLFSVARFRMHSISSDDSFSKTTTLHLLSRALFRLKDGFSVVAPINVIVPFSTWGKNVSC